MKNVAVFAAGFVVGFAALFVLMLIFGDYEEAAVATQPVLLAAAPVEAVAATNNAPAALTQESGPTYVEVCKPQTNNMTDPQITAYAKKYIGQRVGRWRGWVYDVVSRSDGTYNLEIAMQERGLFWSRDIVIENIVSDLAERLNVEQPVSLSGRIARVEIFLDAICNPLYIDDYVLIE